MRSFSITPLLFGCEAQKPTTGNESGGAVMHSGMNPQAAFEAAQKHCQAYGKSARITSIRVRDYTGTGDPVLFDCL